MPMPPRPAAAAAAFLARLAFTALFVAPPFAAFAAVAVAAAATVMRRAVSALRVAAGRGAVCRRGGCVGVSVARPSVTLAVRRAVPVPPLAALVATPDRNGSGRGGFCGLRRAQCSLGFGDCSGGGRRQLCGLGSGCCGLRRLCLQKREKRLSDTRKRKNAQAKGKSA
jgi:hypothetical protein